MSKKIIGTFFMISFLVGLISPLLAQAYLEEVRACHLLQEGKAEEALQLLERKLKRYPNNFDCHLYKGVALYFLGKKEAAFDVLNKVEFETEKLAKAGATLEAGKRLQAFSQEDLYLAQRGGVVFSKERKGLLKYVLAIMYKEKRDYKNARKRLEEALKVNYSPQEVRRQLGLINCFLKDYKAAEKVLQPLLVNPEPELEFFQGYILYHQGQVEKARQILEKLSSELPLARKSLACLLYNEQQYQESLSLWEALLKDNPRDVQAKRNQARCYFHLGEKDKAQQIFDEMGLKIKVEKYSPKKIPLLLADLFPKPEFDFLCDLKK
ncbi:MAG TPA: tetratricopeptide repeat protein [Candidatus Aminicenantes bacterium]|nr:tetratricopeptide repeat protein [Candidatus Aminicenantes bacterium]